MKCKYKSFYRLLVMFSWILIRGFAKWCLVLELFSAAQSAALSPARETNGLIPESMSRPADIFLPTWHGGRPAALVISPLQQSIVLESAFTPAWSCPSCGTQRKLAAHLQPCHSVGVTLIPLVVESLGGLSEDLIKTARDIGDFMDQRVNPSHARSSCTKHLHPM